ncbi:hypothetical protein P5V15_009556 [Pogonomyrmex californicus]
MYPCFRFCYIIGIFPYKINASIFELSKPHYILLTVITCVCCIYGLIDLYLSHITISTQIDIISVPAFILNDFCNILGCFIIIVTCILSGPQMRLLQTIWKISSRLPPKFYQKLSKQIHIKDIIGFIYAFGIALINNSNTKIRNFFVNTYVNMVIFQIDMLYMNCVCVLKACFKEINNNLIHMQELMANDEPHISRLIYHKQRNPFLIIKLNALKKQHLTISKTVQNLNTIFSLQLLASITISFSTLTFNLYYYVLMWSMISATNILDKIRFQAIFLLYMMYSLIKLILIVWACETSKNEALQISIAIHDVFNNITDKQIKNELQLFSLQISHCNNTFSAKGFTIDAKLLAEIIGSIATYLLILFQFLFVLSSCNEKIAHDITSMMHLGS